jgi:hypothetical protein
MQSQGLLERVVSLTYAPRHLSLNATSIDIGAVTDSSHITSNSKFGPLNSFLHKQKHEWVGLQTRLEELKTVLLAVMRGSAANSDWINLVQFGGLYKLGQKITTNEPLLQLIMSVDSKILRASKVVE